MTTFYEKDDGYTPEEFYGICKEFLNADDWTSEMSYKVINDTDIESAVNEWNDNEDVEAIGFFGILNKCMDTKDKPKFLRTLLSDIYDRYGIMVMFMGDSDIKDKLKSYL